MESKNIAESLFELLPAKIVTGQEFSAEDLVVLHNQQSIESFEKFAPRPRRTKQLVKCSDVLGFIEYVNAYKGEGTSLFPSPKNITAVIDYHAKERPSWCEHRAVFNLAHTVEWQAWVEAKRRWMDQRDFAFFLEEHINSIDEPAAGVVMSAVRQFKATTTMRHVAEVDQAGNQAVLEFRKEASATTKSEVAFPPELKILLRAYEGTEVFDDGEHKQLFRFTVALRWKVADDNSGVQFSYDILGLELLKREAYTNLVKAVKEAIGVPTFVGANID